MIFLSIYFFLYSGFASFGSYLLGLGSELSDNSDKIALVLGLLYLGNLFIRRQIRINPITYFIAGYIILRGLILAGFAFYYEYDVLAYVFPLKNWLALLFFFIIGQSIDFSFERLNRILFIVFALFVSVAIAYEAVALIVDFGSDLSSSRLPFLKYRIPVDIFMTVYIYMILTMQYLSKRVPFKRYLLALMLVIAALFVSQIQQMLVGLVIISLFLFISYVGEREIFRSQFLFYLISILLVGGTVAYSFYAFFTSAYQDLYFSLFRRNLLVDFVKEKIMNYPLSGYPIPSPSISENIPSDLWNTFFNFNFSSTIFPSDVPALFVLAEEGILGVLYVGFFLWLCYRRNQNTKYFIFLLLATLTNFRLYYLITLVSSFSYFMLGYFTSPRRTA